MGRSTVAASCLARRQALSRVVLCSVARLFLAVWLAAFTVQTTDFLTWVAPDTCTEDVRGSDADPCPDGCARCQCCARVLAYVSQAGTSAFGEHVTGARLLPPLDPFTIPSPHGVLHIPKNSLT
jgi:hypothetical protein